MADTKTNYTPEQTAEIVQLYLQGVDIEQIAQALGKTSRSIIAKLSREGVYKSKQKAGTGSKRITKAQLLEQIATALGVEAIQIMSLEKGSHEAIELLHTAVVK